MCKNTGGRQAGAAFRPQPLLQAFREAGDEGADIGARMAGDGLFGRNDNFMCGGAAFMGL